MGPLTIVTNSKQTPGQLWESHVYIYESSRWRVNIDKSYIRVLKDVARESKRDRLPRIQGNTMWVPQVISPFSPYASCISLTAAEAIPGMNNATPRILFLFTTYREIPLLGLEHIGISGMSSTGTHCAFSAGWRMVQPKHQRSVTALRGILRDSPCAS